MRSLLFALGLFACGNDEAAQQKCADGAKAVDGVACCAAVVQSACKAGDQCIEDGINMCSCINDIWQCNVFRVHDLSAISERD